MTWWVGALVLLGVLLRLLFSKRASPPKKRRMTSRETSEISELLRVARAKLAAGDSDGAIGCALRAAKINSGGNEAALRGALDRAKATAAKARRRERAIRPNLNDDEAAELAAARAALEDVLSRDAIVDPHILQDAFEDGSSVVCVRCGDLVKRSRWGAHRDAWCRMLEE